MSAIIQDNNFSRVPTELAYLSLRSALNRYQKPTAELDAHELKVILDEAHRQYQLENLILNAPEAQGVVVPEQRQQAALQEVQARYDDEQTFHDDIARNGMNIENFQQALQRELYIEAILERVGANAPAVEEHELKAYYHTNPDKFNAPEMRTVRHILITVNPDYPENTYEAARERLLNLATRLRRDLKRFEKLAHKYSECPSALQGGLIGKVLKGQLFPSLDATLFTMRENQLSGIVESEMGFHLLYCEKIHPAGNIPLVEARPKILELLQNRRRQIYQKNWIKQLQQQAANLENV
ncbi:nitrogen fixation protein NifM [Beggiatoa alba B18LD]|uniref:peptidylprolyl isomerase n=1 Tax=Beggiatoa alba B18LD TaxID=395493 RepID=I3CCY0_9GAMM|nr:nitrogen fixation protein NifM [Beggiatoa alba]EIJ41473.1 nitrogen fixation protein NifM [Beggiatoa alba B18LD]